MYRFFEILPGALAWGTIFLMVLLSSKLPLAVAVFIILFDTYWLLKTIYLSFHLRTTFSAMRNNMRTNWLEKLNALDPIHHPPSTTRWSDLYHLIVFPMYDESYEVVRDSFESLCKANYPKENFLVVLAIEERAGEPARQTAERITAEYGRMFGGFMVTTHPAGIPGELPGKGANESWAAREAERMLLEPRKIPAERVLVSAFDIDTQIFKEYFGRLTHAFLASSDRLRAIYQPIPLFSNNIYQAPALARIVAFSATFWQMMQQARVERLTTFSSQSVPLPVLRDIGYWQKDVVSEDSRIFWQAYLAYHGNFRVVPLFYPVSMDANVTRTFWGTMKSLYRQQRRWGWGVENVPYMLNGFRKDKLIPRAKKWFWSFSALEGFHSWATNSLMIFALGWLPLVLGGGDFSASLLSYSLPRITRLIIGLSMVGVATSAILSILLLPPRPRWFRKRHYFFYVIEWLLIPITLIIFGAFPGLEAQTRLMLGGKWRLGFWVTPKSRIQNSETRN